MNEQTELSVIPLEQKVEQEFKLEIVKLIPDPEAAIAKLKENYMTIKVTDKASFKKADEGRKDVKNFRVMGEKVCDAQRADLEVKKKAWIKKKEDWGDTLGEIEDYLIAETEKWKQAEQKRKDEEAEKLEAEKKRLDLRLLERQQELGKFSVLFSDNTFMLGEVRYSYEKVREADDELYQNEIYPAFKAIFDQHEEERRQQELERQEAEEKQRQEAEQLRQEQEQLKKEQEEMKQQRFELRRDRLLALGMTELRSGILFYNSREVKPEHIKDWDNSNFQGLYDEIANEIDADKKEAEERKERERIAEENQKTLSFRIAQLDNVNVVNKLIYDIKGELIMSEGEMVELLPEEFEEYKIAHNELVAQYKSEQERKRQEEEEQKRVEQEKDAKATARQTLLAAVGVFTYPSKLRDLEEIEWQNYYDEQRAAYDQKKHEEWLEQERIKKQQEDERKAAQLAEAKDKEKWQEIMSHLEKTPILEMRSQQYRTKMKIVRDFLADLKSK